MCNRVSSVYERIQWVNKTKMDGSELWNERKQASHRNIFPARSSTNRTRPSNFFVFYFDFIGVYKYPVCGKEHNKREFHIGIISEKWVYSIQTRQRQRASWTKFHVFFFSGSLFCCCRFSFCRMCRFSCSLRVSVFGVRLSISKQANWEKKKRLCSVSV